VGESAQPTAEQDSAPAAEAAAAPPVRARVTPLQLIATGVPSFFAGVIGTLVIFVLTRTMPPVPGPAATGAETPPPASAPASGFVRTGKAENGPEGEARRALARFRDGIGACSRDVIGVLPGTSPPVPGTMTLMKNGVYASALSDWRTPVYTCAKYSETAPQPFQIQWQRGATPNDGLGVAWIDDDRDNKPDRAFGFTARLVKKKEVTFGEIVPLSPVPKVLPAR
jgi:hypothetical protein